MPSLWEQKHELRRSIVNKIRTACARSCLDNRDQMITYREMRRLATEIGTLADPRTIDGYLETLFDAAYFEMTLDRESVRLLQIPLELAYGAVAPKGKITVVESAEISEISRTTAE